MHAYSVIGPGAPADVHNLQAALYHPCAPRTAPRAQQGDQIRPNKNFRAQFRIFRMRTLVIVWSAAERASWRNGNMR